MVAFPSTAHPPPAKVVFLLVPKGDPLPCLPGSPSATTAPCVHSQVTLNTGAYPQIAMVPHSHLAFVTPGGLGFVNGVDVTKSSSSLAISGISLNSGLVTVTVTVPTGQTLSLNPGNPGSVLIQGVPLGTTNKTNFNGVFTIVTGLSSNNFNYVLNSTTNTNDTDTVDSNSFAFFGSPNVSIGFSQTAQGIAINPITRTAAIADANATGSNAPQIDFLNSLDQSITSIIFHAGCTFYTTTLPCSNAPELLGTSSVAFQPYSNLLVSYNPQQNQVSISNPTTQQRYAFACNLSAPPPLPPTPAATSCIIDPKTSDEQIQFLAQTKLNGQGTSSVTVTAGGPSRGLDLFCGLAIDPGNYQGFVLQSGSGT